MLVAVVCWGVGAAIVAWQTVAAADDARADLDRVRAELSVDSLVDGTARDNLAALRADLADVHRGAASPLVAPLRIVPGVGRQLSAAEALSDAGLDGTDIGLDILDELTATLDEPLPAASERLELIDRVRTLLADGRAALAELDLGPDGPLVPSLAEARTKATDGLADLDDFLGRAEAISGSIRALLSDGDYVVLAANNAEMRAGSGMFLQVGELDVVDGSLTAGELTPAQEIMLPPGAVAADSATYDDLWGFLEPTVEWRNLAASPRFEVTAELASRMWEGLGNDRPAGVLAVDPYALRALLRATGPVEVDGLRIGPDEVVPYLLNEQYDVFSDNEDYDDYVDAQGRRRDRLGGLVDATFDALAESSTDPVRLLEELRDAVRGRHILAWAADDEVQQGWVAADMAGTLEVDSLGVFLLNRGVNKLDPFTDVAASLSFESLDRETVRGTLDVTVRNQVPDGEVRYVAGPAPDIENVDAYGDYAGILTISLPGVARNGRIEGVESLEVADPDGPTLSLATKFGLDQGAERTFRVTFEVPVELDSVRLEPSARPEPVVWTIGDTVWDDGEHHRIPVRTSDR